MIPIDFILNFQVSAAKASSGIRQLNSSVEALYNQFATLQTDFDKWFKTSMPQELKGMQSNLGGLGLALEDTFNAELLDLYNKKGVQISDTFSKIYAVKEMKDFTNAFDGLVDKVKFFAPYLDMTQEGFEKMATSMLDLRKAAPDQFKTLSQNIADIGTNFHSMNKKEQEIITDIFDNFAKSDKSIENLKAINKEMDIFVERKKKLEDLKKAFSSVFGMSPTLEDFRQKIARAAGAYSAWDDARDAQDAMTKSIQRLGLSADKTFGSVMKSTGQFSKTVLTVGLRTQVSMKEATAAMTELLDLRVTDKISDLEELGQVSIQMGQAFGMSNQEAAQFIKSLYKIGGLSKSQVRQAADAMANVQNNLGLTAAEASAVATQVGSMVRTMKVFGGKITDIKAMTTGVAKLNVAFEKAGLSASEANDMLTSMLDPDRLEDNILLFQGLGMSASDAIGMMQGDASKLGDMDERMVKLAKSLKAQYGGNVFALKEMAAQYGMSLEKVQQLSTLTKKDLDMKKGEAKLADAAEKSRASMNEQWKRLMDTMNVLMQSFVLPLINLLTWILKPIASIALSVTALIDKLHSLGGAFSFLGDVISKIVGLGLLAVLLGVTLNFGKMIPMVGSLTKGLFSMKDGFGGIAKSAKDAIANMLKFNKVNGKDLGSKIPKKGMKGKVSKDPTAQLSNNKKPGGGALDSLSKIKPAQLLALGAAIFFIAAGVALITFSVSLLAKAMAELNPEQTTALIKIMAIVMGGMVGIMIAFSVALFVLGAAGLASALGIIAVGAAIFLIAAGVAIVVLAISHLIKTIAQSADGILKLAGNIGIVLPAVLALAAGLGLIAAAMLGIGLAAIPAIVGLTAFSGTLPLMLGMIPVIKSLGNAFNNMGNGIKNIADFGVAAGQSLNGLKETISGLGGNFSSDFVAQLSAINSELQKMSLSSVIIGAGASLLKGILPEKSDTQSATSAGTDRVASLIAESNSYLSTIMDNTDKIVKILSGEEKETKQTSYSRTYTPKNLINKEI